MTYWKLIKNGRIWDCFTHQSDAIRYQDKIMREEPETPTAVIAISEKEFREWRELLSR